MCDRRAGGHGADIPQEPRRRLAQVVSRLPGHQRSQQPRPAHPPGKSLTQRCCGWRVASCRALSAQRSVVVAIELSDLALLELTQQVEGKNKALRIIKSMFLYWYCVFRVDDTSDYRIKSNKRLSNCRFAFCSVFLCVLILCFQAMLQLHIIIIKGCLILGLRFVEYFCIGILFPELLTILQLRMVTSGYGIRCNEVFSILGLRIVVYVFFFFITLISCFQGRP